jgi:hypothetical protein
MTVATIYESVNYTPKNGMTTKGILQLEESMGGLYYPFGDLEEIPEYMDGSLAVHCRSIMREYMARGSSFGDILGDMHDNACDDECQRIYQEPLDVMPAIGCNMALALSIPGPDWLELFQYCQRLDGEMEREEFACGMAELARLNPVNAYSILRDCPTEQWQSPCKIMGFGQDKLLKMAVLFDDLEMVLRIGADQSPTAFEYQVDRALAGFQFDPFARIRAWHNAVGGISMTEHYARAKHQAKALETWHGRPDVFFSGQKTDDNPKQYRLVPKALPIQVTHTTHQGNRLVSAALPGSFDLEQYAVKGSDHMGRRLPRHAAFMQDLANEVASLYFSDMNKRIDDMSDDVKATLNLLVEDFEAHGMPMEKLYFKHVMLLNPGTVCELGQSSALRSAYVKALLKSSSIINNGLRSTGQFMALLLKRVPIAEIEEHATTDQQLQSAYDATGNRLFLNKMTEKAQEHQLQSDLGI